MTKEEAERIARSICVNADAIEAVVSAWDIWEWKPKPSKIEIDAAVLQLAEILMREAK